MEKLKNLFKQFKPFNIKDKKCLSNLSEGYISSLISYEYIVKNKTIFLVLPNINLAQTYYDNISMLVGSENVVFYPADELLTSILSLGLESFKIERIFTRGELIKNSKKIVILNQASAMRKTLGLEKWKKAILKFKPRVNYDFKYLSERLVNYGYKKEYTVIKQGEFSIRGSIIDVFPLGSETPYRLDFFDTELEKIKIYDPKTQISIGEVNEFILLPMSELFYDDLLKGEVVKRMEEYLLKEKLTGEVKDTFNKDIDSIYENLI